MVEKLARLYNTLMLIETKGENTKYMAQCLTYVNTLMNECAAKKEAEKEKVGEAGDK